MRTYRVNTQLLLVRTINADVNLIHVQCLSTRVSEVDGMYVLCGRFEWIRRRLCCKRRLTTGEILASCYLL